MNPAISVAFLILAVFMLAVSMTLYSGTPARYGRPRLRLAWPELPLPFASITAPLRTRKGVIAETIRSLEETAPAKDTVANFKGWDHHANAETLVMVKGCLENPNELRHLRSLNYHNEYFYNVELPGEQRQQLADICFAQFVVSDTTPWAADSVRFRYSVPEPSEKPASNDLEAMDSVLRVVRPSERWSDARWRRLVDLAVCALDSDFRDPSTGLFGRTRTDGPSVFGTFAAVASIWNIYPWSTNEDKTVLNKWLDGISRPLLCDEFWATSGSGYGCRFGPDKDPCISVTEYVYRIAATQRRILKTETPLHEHLCKNSKGILQLVKQCQGEKGRGFSRSPGLKPTPGHTRAALQLMRTMLDLELITYEDLAWLDPAGILSFLEECQRGFAFANRPGLVPSLCSSRASVNSAKILEVLKLNGDIVAGSEYDYRQNRLAKSFDRFDDFVHQCHEKELYWSFPAEYVEG